MSRSCRIWVTGSALVEGAMVLPGRSLLAARFVGAALLGLLTELVVRSLVPLVEALAGLLVAVMSLEWQEGIAVLLLNTKSASGVLLEGAVEVDGLGLPDLLVGIFLPLPISQE